MARSPDAWACRLCGAEVELAPTDTSRLTDVCPNCRVSNYWHPSQRWIDREAAERQAREAARNAALEKLPQESGFYWFWFNDEWTVVEILVRPRSIEDWRAWRLGSEVPLTPEEAIEEGTFGPKLEPPPAPDAEERKP